MKLEEPLAQSWVVADSTTRLALLEKEDRPTDRKWLQVPLMMMEQTSAA